MTDRTPGLHHVTAVASDMQRTIDFYTGTLGLRLVKRTVNFDDPTAHHCYFADAAGTPGTLLTFFAWPEAVPARAGRGQARTVAFRVPPDAIAYWHDRLTERGVVVDGPYERFDERLLAFRDPDGLELELVAREGAVETDPWTGGPIPERRAIRSLDGVSLTVAGVRPTAAFLRDLGYETVGEERGRTRFETGTDRGGVVDLLASPGAREGRAGAGGVHHVAVRAPDDPTLEAYREVLTEHGRRVSQVIDRVYFRSIYVREPGGVLFEVSTEGPGVTVDEDADALGSSLVLPEWLEDDRDDIEATLPDLHTPTGGPAAS